MPVVATIAAVGIIGTAALLTASALLGPHRVPRSVLVDWTLCMSAATAFGLGCTSTNRYASLLLGGLSGLIVLYLFGHVTRRSF